MTYIESILLGIIQAATEFLPISSSGHLVLAKNLFDINTPGIVVEVILHLGTLLSIIVFYRYEIRELLIKSIVKKDSNTQMYIFQLGVATVPAVIVGITLKSQITSFFNNITFVSIALICTGCILILSKKYKDGVSLPNWSTVLIIGIAQAFAIIPGISRSGVTIAAAVISGMNHKEAARFSFLLAIPILFGVGIIEISNINNLTNIQTGPIIIGFLSAFIGGLFIIRLLLHIIYNKQFWMFGLYCLGIGLLTLTIITI